MPTRRVVPSRNFANALCRPELLPYVRGVIAQLARHPERAPSTFDGEYHVLRTAAYGEYPALRLLYWFDDAVLYVIQVELYEHLPVKV